MLRAWCPALLLAAACSEPSVVVRFEGSPETTRAVLVDRDGFAITFEKVLFVVANVRLAGERTVLLQRSARVFDAKMIDAFEVARREGVPRGRYDRLGFDVVPTAVASRGNVDEEDVHRMTSKHLSIYVEGVAIGRFVHAFRWGFDRPLRFEDCAVDVVVERGVSVAPIVVHGERLFGEDGFRPFADADRNGDHYTKEDELMGLRTALEERLPTMFAPCRDQRSARSTSSNVSLARSAWTK